MNLKYTVDSETDGKTVKQILKTKLKLSERLITKLKYAGKILLNSSPAFVNVIVKNGDCVEVLIDFVEENEDIVPEPIHLDILYEDDFLIAINKQPSIVVHPTFGHSTGTIANGLMYHWLNRGIQKKIRPVSRLDRDTSGIIIFAKNQYIQEDLIRQMQDKAFTKEYLGIVHGIVKTTKGTIDLPIERKPGSMMERHVSKEGSPSVTHFEVLEYMKASTLLKFNLETGRTHQIRVHCQAIGHPLLGDTLYPHFYDEEYIHVVKELLDNTGNLHLLNSTVNLATPSEELLPSVIERQALHSIRVVFNHPINQHQLKLNAPILDDMIKALEILRK